MGNCRTCNSILSILAIVVILLALTTSLGCSVQAGRTPPMTIVQDGQPMATIVLSADCSYLVEDAVKDLQRCLEKMSGARLPICRNTEVYSGNVIFVGRMEQVDRLIPDLDGRDLGPDGFAMKSLPGRLILTGQSDGYIHKFRYKDYRPEVDGTRADPVLAHCPNGRTDCGTPNAVYAFLEMLGCRWYAPGADGEFVPSTPTITVPSLAVYSKPDFASRALGSGCAMAMGPDTYREYATWMERNRAAINTYRQGHSLGWLLDPAIHGKAHPEYYALIDGKRLPQNGQPCLSNPEAVEAVYTAVESTLTNQYRYRSFPVGQFDTWNWCECDNCRAAYGKETFTYTTHEAARDVGVAPSDKPFVNYAHGYLTFVNSIAERIERKFPGCLLTYYAMYNIPGVPTVKPRDNVMPGMCHIVPNDETWRKDVARWEAVSRQLHYYTYIGWRIAFPRLSIGDDIRWCHRHKGIAMYLEQDEHSPIAMLPMYIASKVLWDTTTDTDSLLAEFYRNYFGQAEKPMRMFYETFHQATYDAVMDYDCYYVYPDSLVEVMDRCRAYIDEALALAGDPVVTRRIGALARYWDGAELQVKAQQAMTRWKAARCKKSEQAARDAMKLAVDYFSRTDEFYIKNRLGLFNNWLAELNGK